MSRWFEVDKNGLAKLMAGRSKAFVLYELLQNAWDQDVTRVDVTIQQVEGVRAALITVTDDDPEGFADLRDAFTLFAESRKKGSLKKRGRFNLGEKLVLALAKSAYIETTTGAVEFTAAGERLRHRKGREKGSMFRATIPMTKGEIEEMVEAAKRLIVPAGVITMVNGRRLPDRAPVASFEETLPTVLADDEGVLRKTTRKTPVYVYEPMPGETATLYEMGIPVVEIHGSFHVDVNQKVPLNMDRDNVTPGYLQAIRVAVLNHTHDKLDESDASQVWVKAACGDDRASPEAVRRVLNLRFGENAVRYDPSDPEANKRSQAEGRPVVYGGNLSAEEWDSANRAGVLPPAGEVTPSPKPYDPDGEPLNVIPESEWDEGMKQIAVFAHAMAQHVLDCHIQVTIAREAKWPYRATYGDGRLVFNYSKCGRRFFEQGITKDVVKLLLHEFGHHYVSDHLSEAYHDTLCDLGARFTFLALDLAGLFRL